MAKKATVKKPTNPEGQKTESKLICVSESPAKFAELYEKNAKELLNGKK